jgi:transposase
VSTEAPKRSSRKGIPNHPVEFRRHLAKLACEPGVSVARLAMEHGVSTNLLFKWRRALRAGEYDPVGLLPVTVEAPTQEMVRPAPIARPICASYLPGSPITRSTALTSSCRGS